MRLVRDLDLWRRFLVESVLGETLSHKPSSFTAVLVEGLAPSELQPSRAPLTLSLRQVSWLRQYLSKLPVCSATRLIFLLQFGCDPQLRAGLSLGDGEEELAFTIGVGC